MYGSSGIGEGWERLKRGGEGVRAIEERRGEDGEMVRLGSWEDEDGENQ